MMILESITLDVIPGKEDEFEQAFNEAQLLVMAAGGYVSHELHRCVERHNRYLLHIRWGTVEDHTIGFRQSEAFQAWRALLHHFYSPAPVVEHYNQIV